MLDVFIHGAGGLVARTCPRDRHIPFQAFQKQIFYGMQLIIGVGEGFGNSERYS